MKSRRGKPIKERREEDEKCFRRRKKGNKSQEGTQEESQLATKGVKKYKNENIGVRSFKVLTREEGMERGEL